MNNRDRNRLDRSGNGVSSDGRGPRDSREALRRRKRLAKIRKRQRTNLLIILAIIAVIVIVLVTYGIKAMFGKKDKNKPSTPNIVQTDLKDDETPSAQTDEKKVPVADERRVFFNTPNELVYEGRVSIPEKIVPKEGETPTKVSFGDEFSKDMFFGDSIMDTLRHFRYVYNENSVASIGLNTDSALQEIDKVVARKPENVYMLFGMNDIKSGIDTDAFVSRYKSLIDKIKTEVPDANIFVQSITPVDESKVSDIKNNDIREFNKALEKLAKDENVSYVDLYSIENLSGYHETDGIHFVPTFGDVWARYLLKTTKNIEVSPA